MRYTQVMDYLKMNRLLTVKEAAAALNISERMVWKLIEQKRLSAVKVGKRATRVSITALNAFIESSETLPTPSDINPSYIVSGTQEIKKPTIRIGIDDIGK